MVTKRPNDEESNQDAQDGDSGKNNKRQKRDSSPPPPPELNSASTTPDSDGKELYYCDLCYISFTQKKNLARHLCTKHSGRKLYKCPCGYETGRSTTYQKHLMGNHNRTKEEAKDEVEALVSKTKGKKGFSGISTSTLSKTLLGKENLLPQAEDLGTTPDFTQREATEPGISTEGVSTSSSASSSPISMLNLDSSSSSDNESQPELKLEVSMPEVEVETEPQPNENNNVNEEDTGLISVLAGLLNTATQVGKLAQVENAVDDALGTKIQVEEIKREPEHHVEGNEEENLGAVVALNQNATVASSTSGGEKLEDGDEEELTHAETDRNEEDTMDTVIAPDQNAIVASSTSGGENLEGGGDVEIKSEAMDTSESPFTNEGLNVFSSSQSVVQNEEPWDETLIAQNTHSNMPVDIPIFHRETMHYDGPGIFSSSSGGPQNALWNPNLNQNALGELRQPDLGFLSQDVGNDVEMLMSGNTVEPAAPNSSAPWTVESAGLISTIAVCTLIMLLELLWILLG